MSPPTDPPSESSRFPALTVELPAWVESHLASAGSTYDTVEDRMRLAIELSRLNIEHGTGGPFGAAIFDMHSGELIAPGVNIVVDSRWSGGHAEMVAFAIAQQAVGTHDLGAPEFAHHELVTSTEPCSMCLGATPWSGVKRLVCAATHDDASAVGFDEGPKPANWIGELESRGISVVQQVLRDEARKVLQAYGSGGGYIYNGRAGS